MTDLNTTTIDFENLSLCECCEMNPAVEDGLVCVECDDSCPGCGSRPGDGYTAGCHHPEGCGYYKAAMGALSNRLPGEGPQGF